MNALVKIATITNLVAEIGDCDEVQYSLDGFIKVLNDLKTALNTPKKVVMKYQLDAEGNRVGEGVPVPNTFEPHGDHIKRSSLNLENGEWVMETELMAKEDFDAPSPVAETDDEEEDDEPTCSCNTRMDIRGRCDPIRDAKRFSRCPARFDTTYFLINNDHSAYTDIQSCSREGKHIKYMEYAKAEPYFLDLSYADDEDKILMLIEEDEENEEQYCCLNCDGFIPLADEDSAKWCDSEERLVCYSCKDECFCAECDDYFAEEDLEYLNRDNEDTCKYCCDCIAPKKCDALEEEITGYFAEMDADEDKVRMLEEIKNVIAKYHKK